MKFVALALALLLAVGSQATPVPADVPTQLAQARSVLNMYIEQAKTNALQAVVQLDEQEFGAIKANLNNYIEGIYTQIKSLQTSVSPITDSVVGTVSDVTADFRQAVNQDIENLKTSLAAQRQTLMEGVDRHMAQYSALLKPVYDDYIARHNAEMPALKARMEPIIADLRAKVQANVEETKNNLMPMVEAVRAKVMERLDSLKEMVAPYVEEYKDQASTVYDQARNIRSEDLAALKTRVEPLVADIKTKLQEIFVIVSGSFGSS